jgi:CRISPR-associated endonuclease/helicase Cas3
MTATLQPSRRKALEEACIQRGGIKTVLGPQGREMAKRYHLVDAAENDPWAEVVEVLNRQEKVLWVCNTVKRAMAMLEEAIQRGLPVQPFHSRYRYRDRLKRQQAIIQGFRGDAPILAVTTQVAEMSLDISADLLVSEYAPVPAMIQRLGRLNRFEETPRQVKKALFIQPPQALPYSDEEYQGLKEWISVVADETPKSQSELSQAFIEICEAFSSGEEISPIPFCEWVDGLWRSLKDQRTVEEASFSIEVIREEDRSENPIEMAIPMPIPKLDVWKEWDKLSRFYVAPVGSITYDHFRGAEWR